MLRFATQKDLLFHVAGVTVIAMVAQALICCLLLGWEAYLERWWVGFVATLLLAPSLSWWVAIHVKEIHELKGQLAHQLAHDELTGLMSRREVNRQEDHIRQHAGIVMMLDLDHFKTVNDRFGHAEGDRVLASVAECLRSTCRDTDVVARFGGEEFMVFVETMKHEIGHALAERLSKAVSRNCRIVRDNQIHVMSVSGGWVFKPAGAPLEHYLQQADKVLYEAKKAGRDRILGSVPAHDCSSRIKRA